MSFFVGGGGKKVKPQYTGLQIQTSSSTMAITLMWGLNRTAPNIIWYDNFQSHKQQEKAGKGMGGNITSYTYSASLILALCQGPIFGIDRVFRNQEKPSSYTALGFTLFTGEMGQAPWGYLTSEFPDAALSYSGISYLAAANYDLGQSAATPQHSFEVQALRYNSSSLSNGDADPALVIADLLTDPEYGTHFPPSSIDDDQLYSGPNATTTGDGSYQTYCRARGFGINPVLSSQEAAASIMDRWTLITDTAVVWTGYSLKLIPYGTEEITAHGYHFVPNLVPVYSLTDSNYVVQQGEPPVKVTRSDPAYANNALTLTVRNRENEYNEAPTEWKDQGLIDLYGIRQGNGIDAPEICTLEMGSVIVGLIGQRLAYSRNDFECVLPAGFCLLEPMDIVVLNDPILGPVAVWVDRLEEDEEYNWKLVGKEIPPGIAQMVTSQDVTNNPINMAMDPGPINVPIVFQPPLELTNGSMQVWAGVSGGDGTDFNKWWGGANVYVSTDGVSYQQIGQVADATRQGILTTGLPDYSGSNPDTVNTVGVDLSMSGGQLQSVTSDEASRAATLSLVSGELISFQDATLTSTYHYDLSTLYRGLYGTTTTAHSSGAPIIRLDESIFRYDLPPEYIGLELFFKFQSFNIWGGGVQDLADCVEYSFTPGGYTIAPPDSVGLSFVYRVQADGTFFIRGNIEIVPSTSYNIDRYDVQITSNSGSSWDSISSIASGNTLTYFEPAVATTDYQTRVRTVSDGLFSPWEYSAIVNSGTVSDPVPPNSPTGTSATTDLYYAVGVSWNAPIGGEIVRTYEVWGAVGNTVPFGSCSLIGTVPYSITYFSHTGIIPNEEWTYYTVATNFAGSSSEDGPVMGTAIGSELP